MEQNKEDQSEKQKALNFYVTKIDAFKSQIQEQYQELQKPLYEFDKIQLKESSKNFLFNDKKQALAYLCLKKLCYTPNINVTEVHNELKNRCEQKEVQYLDNISTEDKKLSDILMEVLESKNFIKDNELAQSILNVKDVIFWMPRDNLLRDWNVTDLRTIKSIYNYRKLQQKTFQKMFEMLEKKEKILKKNKNEKSLESLKKSFDNYFNINVKLKNEFQKLQKKVQDFLKPKVSVKKIKKVNTSNKQKQKEPQKKQLKKSNTDKNKNNNKEKKQLGKIETFFEKPGKKEIKKTKKYNRWESIGQFPLERTNKKIDLLTLDNNSFNIQTIKDIFIQQKKQYKKNLSNFRLSKIEDFKRYTKEYYGIFTHKIQVNYDQQYEPFQFFNYELSTQEELLHEEADTIKSDEQSQEDEINPEMEDFIVDDDYMSGEEDQSQFEKFKVRNYANEDKPDEELIVQLTAINLTTQEFPLLFEKKKKSQEDEELKISQIQKLILNILGCGSKKVALQLIEKSEIKKSSKEVLKYVKENGYFVYYVNPDDVQQYCKVNYFELLEKNIKQEKIEIQNYSSFMEYLILHLHGLSNSANDKEERLYKKLKQSYYSTVSKSHIEKCIKKLSKFGFMQVKKNISENIARNKIHTRFTDI